MLEAFNQLLPDREKLIDDFRTGQTALTDCTNIDREIKELPQELEVVIVSFLRGLGSYFSPELN